MQASLFLFLVTVFLYWYPSTSSTSGNWWQAVKVCRKNYFLLWGPSVVTCEGSSPLVLPEIRMNFDSFPLADKRKETTWIGCHFGIKPLNDNPYHISLPITFKGDYLSRVHLSRNALWTQNRWVTPAWKQSDTDNWVKQTLIVSVWCLAVKSSIF